MTVQVLSDVEFGMDLPDVEPDTTLEATRRFAEAVGYSGGGRFEDHDKARAQGSARCTGARHYGNGVAD